MFLGALLLLAGTLPADAETIEDSDETGATEGADATGGANAGIDATGGTNAGTDADADADADAGKETDDTGSLADEALELEELKEDPEVESG